MTASSVSPSVLGCRVVWIGKGFSENQVIVCLFLPEMSVVKRKKEKRKPRARVRVREI